MTLRTLGLVLIWAGAGGALGLLLHRFIRGAWSLEDEEIPAVTRHQQLIVLGALVSAIAGTLLMVWSSI